MQLVQLGSAYWVSRVVYVAAKLGLADHLADGAKSTNELAQITRTHAPSLYRLMRTLASLGILTEGAAQCSRSLRLVKLFDRMTRVRSSHDSRPWQ